MTWSLWDISSYISFAVLFHGKVSRLRARSKRKNLYWKKRDLSVQKIFATAYQRYLLPISIIFVLPTSRTSPITSIFANSLDAVLSAKASNMITFSTGQSLSLMLQCWKGNFHEIDNKIERHCVQDSRKSERAGEQVHVAGLHTVAYNK
jgi:hypothetical protein